MAQGVERVSPLNRGSAVQSPLESFNHCVLGEDAPPTFTSMSVTLVYEGLMVVRVAVDWPHLHQPQDSCGY